MDRWMDRRTDGRTDAQTEGKTDKREGKPVKMVEEKVAQKGTEVKTQKVDFNWHQQVDLAVFDESVDNKLVTSISGKKNSSSSSSP